MNRNLVTIVTFGIALWVAAPARAQSSAATPPMTLTALDYMEIQQLVNRYADAIDYCGNNGYDYADLYTEDGYFAPNMNGKVGTKFQGRERLAAAAGGGVNNCKSKQGVAWDKMSRHVYLNLVITPTADGAKGKTDLLVAGRNGDRNVMEIQGYYEDEYAKTAKGWRFKSRVHVVPSDFRQNRTAAPAPAQPPAPPAAPAAAPAR